MNKLQKFARIIKDPLFRGVMARFRVAAGVEHFTALHALFVSSIIDIGANRGQFALLARAIWPKSTIYSFEPLYKPANVFRRIFSSDPKVVLHQVAIGSENRQMEIHVSRADDSSSLLPISRLQSRLFPGTEEIETCLVPVMPLYDILSPQELEKPALLKIDVQGYERNVLEGCKEVLCEFSYVYVECSFVELYEGQALASEVISFLDDYNFELIGIYNLAYDVQGLALQGDFLFKSASPCKKRA